MTSAEEAPQAERAERHRRHIAKVFRWPAGAVENTWSLEAKHPHWQVGYTNGELPVGSEPGYFARLRRSPSGGYNPRLVAATPRGLHLEIVQEEARCEFKYWFGGSSDRAG
ncbi:hypothetical protein [Spirillospora sp. NPDC047279]|uniref:hypothetical protein n=1 Tax=Spirillospora sp. NPDC047279 TaxID=3155478 RepID=UPI0033DEED74